MMKKRFLLALSAILLIGITSGAAYHYAQENASHRNQPQKASASPAPSPASLSDLEEDDLPVTDASRPETMAELRYQDATKISTFVQDKERFTSNPKLLKDMKGIISRLSPNKLTQPPMPKDEKSMLYGAWTSLDIHDGNGLMYNFLLTNLGGGYVVYVGGENYSFYCDIREEDIPLFREIYQKIYRKYADDPEEE